MELCDTETCTSCRAEVVNVDRDGVCWDCRTLEARLRASLRTVKPPPAGWVRGSDGILRPAPPNRKK